MKIHICHSKTMSHLFEYLRQSICTNIVHITITQNLYDFRTNLWKTYFAYNLYKLIKLFKFVMLVATGVFHGI
jgi:hypothetical protein